MAVQVSIDRKIEEEHGIGYAAASWTVAIVDGFGRALTSIFETLRSARGQVRRQPQMQLVESLALGNRRQLLLVACGDRRYLVGAGADSVNSILAMEPSAALAESAGLGTKTRPRSVGRTSKGPELVCHKTSQMTSEHETGSGVWP